MVNPAHEMLLRAGASGWNDWRRRNGSVTPELSGLRMTASNLAGCELHHARLDASTLIRANLQGADLRYADLRRAQLHEADLSDADLYRANLDGAVLAGARLRRARLYGASLRGAQITVADLRRADLREARLDGADLRESLCHGASFEGAVLSQSELALCQLSGANLLRAAGLVSRQLEAALFDASTLLSPRMGSDPDEVPPIDALVATLRSMLARASGDTVPESVVATYHALVDELSERGLPVEGARFDPGELVRPIDFGARSPGGEAFEVAPVQWLDATLFRARLGRLLERLHAEARAERSEIE